MPRIPTYKRQVYADRTPQTAYKPIPEGLLPKFDPKKGEVMLKKFELERRKSNQQMASNIMQFGQQLFSVLGQLQQAHIATKIREAETQAKNTFDQLYQQFEYDPNYEQFEERFEKAQEKLYEDQTADMGPAVAKAYESKFAGLKGQYETQVQRLVLEKDHAHGQASMKYQMKNAIEKGDEDMLKRVLFGEDIVDRPKQPAESGAPMSVSEWQNTPDGRKSKNYGGTPEEIEAYIEDPDAAVEKYYTPTRVIRNREKEMSKEAFRRYLDAHARSYQKDAYLETGEPREKITTMRVPGAVENKYVSRDEALRLYDEGLYEMMKIQVFKGLAAADPEKAMQKLMERDESGDHVLAPELRQEDRNNMYKKLEDIHRREQDRLQKIDDEMWEKGLDAFRHHELSYDGINTLRSNGLGAERALRLDNMLNARIEQAEKERTMRGQGMDIDASPFITEIRKDIREGVHPDIVEQKINKYNSRGLLGQGSGNKADRLYDENLNRDEDPVMKDIHKRFDTVARKNPEASVAREQFDTLVEGMVYDDKGVRKTDIATYKNVQELADSFLIPFERDNIIETMAGEDAKDIIDDPREYAAQYHTMNELNDVISNGYYVLWDEALRSRYEPIKEIYTDYLVELYNQDRRDYDRQRLDRRSPVAYHDGIRPVLRDRDGNRWVAETFRDQTKFVPYSVERMDQTGRVYNDPELGAIYYVDGDWYKEEDLAAEGRLGKKKHSTVVGGEVFTSSDLMIKDEKGEWWVVY